MPIRTGQLRRDSRRKKPRPRYGPEPRRNMDYGMLIVVKPCVVRGSVSITVNVIVSTPCTEAKYVC
jgi:hypothetical protein